MTQFGGPHGGGAIVTGRAGYLGGGGGVGVVGDATEKSEKGDGTLSTRRDEEHIEHRLGRE